TLPNAAGEPDELPQRPPERHLVQARPLDVPRDAEELRAGRSVRARRRVLRAALAEDHRHVRECLHVVDRRWLAEESVRDRERRLVAGLGTIALDRLEERRLLARDVGTGAAPDLDVERPARIEDVVAEQSGA